MKPLINILLVTIEIALLVACSNDKPIPPPDIIVFKKIITKELMTAGFKQPDVALVFQTKQKNGTQIYEAMVNFTQTNPDQHYVSSISVAKVGTFLSPADYEQRKTAVKQEAGNTTDKMRNQFPDIGKRATQEFWGAGPGGASFGLTFTTSDENFDVQIAVSNLLPDGVEDPDFNVEATARKISNLYDQRLGKNK